MVEALILWESIVNSQWFVKTSFVSGISCSFVDELILGQILFLNKADLLLEKVLVIQHALDELMDGHSQIKDPKQQIAATFPGEYWHTDIQTLRLIMVGTVRF